MDRIELRYGDRTVPFDFDATRFEVLEKANEQSSPLWKISIAGFAVSTIFRRDRIPLFEYRPIPSDVEAPRRGQSNLTV